MSVRFQLQHLLALIGLVALIGCQTPPGSGQGAAPAEPAKVAKRATAVIMGDPPHFEGRFNPSIGSVPGLDVMEEMLNAGTANFTDQGQLRPQLAEAVPSIDNGLWKLFPDGHMETTWHLRSGIVWHDGRLLTSDDLLFTASTGTDKDIPGFADAIYESVESISAPDPLTLVATWKGPFIGADTLFTRVHGLPLPKHILEQPYGQDKAAFANLPYWSDQFIGSGAYKLRELVRGSHAILDANDQFILGRPKVDVWEIKFTPDANVMITTLLSGPSIFWSAGASAIAPIFDGGRRRANTDQAIAAYDQTVANYRETLLGGFQQVEDNLAALRILEKEADTQQRAVLASQKYLELSLTRYRGGITSYLEVTTAQSAAFTDEVTAVNILGRRMTSAVLLIQALGGGWDRSELPQRPECCGKLTSASR